MLNAPSCSIVIIPALAWSVLLVGCGNGMPEELDVLGSDDSIVADELIVAAKPGADQEDLQTLFGHSDAVVRDELKALSVYLVAIEPARRDSVRSALGASPLVEGVFDNRRYQAQATPNDPLYSYQWHLTAIGAPAAWNLTTGSNQVLVAVLDTGVDPDHVDLVAKLRSGGNTFSGSSNWQDVHGHGTAVAGVIAAAADSREGVASVAWDNPILPVRVTNEDGRATSWAIAAGIALAVSEGARVINISFAPLHDDDIVFRQARLAWLAGSLVVISAGNTGQEVSGRGSESVIFVGAVDRSDRLARFSTYGEFIDLVAPGVSIYTTRRGNEYGSVSGTSFAAPVVSGVAALIWSLNPLLRPVTVRAILLSTATDLGPTGYDNNFGAGRVDAEAAVQLTNETVEQSDETPPAVSIRAPATGSSINTQTTVELHATDDRDVAEVTLYLDGLALASDAVSPYLFVLDPRKYASGEHELRAVATDTSGNSVEQTITLFFAGSTDSVRPTVDMIGPANGAAIHGVVTILADVSDDLALARAEILLDNEVIGTVLLTDVEARIAYSWNTTSEDVHAGLHTVGVRVYDTTGNTSTAAVYVTIIK